MPMKQYLVTITVPEDQLAHAVAYATNFFGKVSVTSLDTVRRDLEEVRVDVVGKVRLAPAKRRASPQRAPGAGPTGEQLILEHLSEHGETRLKDLKDLFRSVGRAPNGASPMMTKLRRKGTVQLVKEGVYALTERAGAQV